MTLTADDGRTFTSATEPSKPRLRLRPDAATERLDGAWWPRSTDPVAEIPGLVLAIADLQGPITRVMLHGNDWDSHPRRMAVDGRLVRLGYFASQPAGLLIALSARAGARVDLAIIPPATAPDLAEAALKLAATNGNHTHAQDLVASAGTTQKTAPEDI